MMRGIGVTEFYSAKQDYTVKRTVTLPTQLFIACPKPCIKPIKLSLLPSDVG